MFSKLSIFFIVTLVIVLIASNLWWAYEDLDDAVTEKYQEMAIYDYKKASEELAQLLPSFTKEKSKEEIVKILENVFGETAFEKEGFTCIGFLNYKFDEQGKLTKVKLPYEQY